MNKQYLTICPHCLITFMYKCFVFVMHESIDLGFLETQKRAVHAALYKRQVKAKSIPGLKDRHLHGVLAVRRLRRYRSGTVTARCIGIHSHIHARIRPRAAGRRYRTP